jgi:hypothetical protein
MENLKGLNITVHREFSEAAAATFPDGSLDFVYIDGNHSLLDVVRDLTLWSRKVKFGGIVSGHDYIKLRRNLDFRVVEAVHAFTQARDIDPWFVLGRKKTLPRELRDRERSYLWVNTPYEADWRGRKALAKALRIGVMERTWDSGEGKSR